jgi:predicted anti-sigma-YlaC factor YlaD
VRCKVARRHMTRPDGRREDAARHAAECPDCRAYERELGTILETLRSAAEPEPLPYFRERLRAKITERERTESPRALWMSWSLRTIPVSLGLIAVFIGAILFLSPVLEDEMSRPAALLIENANPLAETNALFNEDKIETRSMMVIFASNEFAKPRRQRP